MNLAIIVVALVTAGYLAFSPRLGRSETWRATVTPLASIMGSGFLISAPLLGHVVGIWALPCMAALLLLAYGVGGALRFNIRHFEPVEDQASGWPQHLALLSRFVLAGAYFISVAYYLQLLAAFALSQLGLENPLWANLLTSSLLVVITSIGAIWGLKMLEGVEKYAVALNLGMVAALLVGLLLYNLNLLGSGGWQLPAVDSTVDGTDLRILLGLLIVVQGFETSRYLGAEHPAEVRIRTMRLAQLVSAGIYLGFVGLATVLFQSDMGSDVTAILELTLPVAAILPLLLTVAAMGSQFSAAVADTAGAGGLLRDLTHNRLPLRLIYAGILVLTLLITWETNVNEVIAIASRAFALYYALQCAVAATRAQQLKQGAKVLTFALLGTACLMVFGFGVSSE